MLKQSLLFYFLLSTFIGIGTHAATAGIPARVHLLVDVDDEYEKLKKRGDSLFVRGEYERAKSTYESILVVVPNYENDAYTKSRIDLSQKALTLRKQASDALNQNKGSEAMEFYQQVLKINSNDPITKGFIADYWSAEGNKFYSEKKYAEAKNRYEEALKYAQRKDILQLQIQNSERFIKDQEKIVTPPIKITTHKPLTGLKIGLGVLAVAAGVQAVLTRSSIQSKLDDLNALSKTVDPDGDDIILTSPLYDQWQQAYNEAKDAKAKESMVTVYAGVAVAAVLAEAALLIIRHKRSAQAKGISLHSAPVGVGLSLRYSF